MPQLYFFYLYTSSTKMNISTRCTLWRIFNFQNGWTVKWNLHIFSDSRRRVVKLNKINKVKTYQDTKENVDITVAEEPRNLSKSSQSLAGWLKLTDHNQRTKLTVTLWSLHENDYLSLSSTMLFARRFLSSVTHRSKCFSLSNRLNVHLLDCGFANLTYKLTWLTFSVCGFRCV